MESDAHVQTPVNFGQRVSRSCGPGQDFSNHRPPFLEASELGSIAQQVDRSRIEGVPGMPGAMPGVPGATGVTGTGPLTGWDLDREAPA
jgi:hypothetical protein